MTLAKRAGVPKRILDVRNRFREGNPWDMARWRVVGDVRKLRNWLADPMVSDDLRVGDAELLARLQAHLKERGHNRVTLITREQLDALKSGRGQTRH
jgi:hypothetical protein